MLKKKYSIWLFIIFMFTLTGCSQGTGDDFGVLGFLPSGIETATGHKLLYNTDYKQVTLIPVVEVLICYFISILCNLMDFMLWFIAWIPGLKQLIALIYAAPDMDLLFPSVFHLHRNFITHSVLNPLFLISGVLMVLLGRFFEWIKAIFLFVALLFALHFLADAMPLKWVGFANIYVGLGSVKLFYLPPFLSKLWLLLNVGAIYFVLDALVY